MSCNSLNLFICTSVHHLHLRLYFYPLDLCLHLIGYECLSTQDFDLLAIIKMPDVMFWWKQELSD